MMRAANMDVAIGHVFNIGSNVPSSIREVNEIIIEEAGKKGQIEPEQINTFDKYGDRYEDIPCRTPDVTKAAEILGWKAQVPVREGIRRFIEWARTVEGGYV